MLLGIRLQRVAARWYGRRPVKNEPRVGAQYLYVSAQPDRGQRRGAAAAGLLSLTVALQADAFRSQRVQRRRVDLGVVLDLVVRV